MKRRGLCYGHYMKAWRYGDASHDAYRPRQDLTGKRFGKLRVISYERRSGEASRWVCRCECGAESKARTGDLNRGTVTTCGAVEHQMQEIVEYTTAHARVARAKGKASEHACVDCGANGAYWSYDHTDPEELRSASVPSNPPYSLDIEHYEPRCVACHKMFNLGRE